MINTIKNGGMQAKNYLFIGDKFTVPNVMIGLGLKVNSAFCAADFYPGEALADKNIPCHKIENKRQVCAAIEACDFDILISNGCPFILPVSGLQKPHQLFLNIHASLLPDLRGAHPVNGALLHKKEAGATCHIMTDEIDKGEIISQVKIPYSDDLDLGLLYMLTFEAEKEAFIRAYENDFAPRKNQPDANANSLIYYTRKEQDMRLDFTDDIENIMRRIKAFSLSSQGAKFTHKGHEYIVLDAEIITNPYFLGKLENYRDGEIIFMYDNIMIIRKGTHFLKLKNIIGDLSLIKRNENIID